MKLQVIFWFDTLAMYRGGHLVLIKKLDTSAIERIGEVDRREHVKHKYIQRDEKLISEAVDWNISRWATDGSAFSTQVRIDKWTPILEQGGAMFGAFEDDTLCGFAIVEPKSIEDVAELVALFVSKDWRKQGIGKQLAAEAYQFAHKSGANALFASSNNSEAAVRFYLSEGFELAQVVRPKLYQKLYAIDAEGIHLVKQLVEN